MNGNTVLIGLIVMLIVTTGGVLVLYETSQNYQQSGRQTLNQNQADQDERLSIVNVIGTNVNNGGVKYVTIQVRYTGSDTMDLNDTYIQLRTDKSIADLTYQNGTANRSVANGFYTQ